MQYYFRWQWWPEHSQGKEYWNQFPFDLAQGELL
jgi:hypothetical protein